MSRSPQNGGFHRCTGGNPFPVALAFVATRAAAVQTAPGYGRDLVAPPGTYDLWIEPADNGKSECLAEKLEVVAGKVTVVE